MGGVPTSINLLIETAQRRLTSSGTDPVQFQLIEPASHDEHSTLRYKKIASSWIFFHAWGRGPDWPVGGVAICINLLN